MNRARDTSAGGSRAIPSSSSAWNVLVAGSLADLDENSAQRLGALLKCPVDWDELIRLAEDQGTSSLLCLNLTSFGDMVPAAILVSLRQGYEKNVHKSLFLTRELIRILDCVEALGIEVIPYKGVVLSEIYYGDMAMRQAGDIDLFVRAGDVARIKRAVGELGYTPRVVVPEAAEQDYTASGYECAFDSPAGKNLLEMQWALQPRFYSVDFDMEGLFDRAVDVSFAGRSVKAPSAEDLLLVLAVHAAKHAWGRLIWLCDIAQILKRENLNWDGVQGRAQEFGIERILHITLLLANRFLGMEIPVAMERVVIADRAANKLADEIADGITSGAYYGELQISYFRLMMRLRERKMDRVRFLARLTFTPGPGEWEAVKLPRVLFPLYRVVRLARLAGRFAQM